MANKVRHRVGREAYLGIRPKEFVLKEKAVKADTEIPIRGRVDVCEMVGEEVLVNLIAGEDQFQVSVNPHKRPVFVGELKVCPLLSLAHIFDGETEENLALPEYVKKSPTGKKAAAPA